jgi:hypothetical protein
MIKATLAVLMVLIAAPVAAQSITDNEPRVMHAIFDDCVGFVDQNKPPFTADDLLPITAAGRGILPSWVPGDAFVYHYRSDRYVIFWGGTARDRFCMMLSNRDSTAPHDMGVASAGFLERLTARAAQAGMTEAFVAGDWSPLITSDWRAPGGDEVLRFTALPTAEDGAYTDVGVFVVAKGRTP